MVHGYLSIGILIISLASIYISFLLLKKASGIIKIPFISTFFWFKYLVFTYIGSAYLNLFMPQYEVSMGFLNRTDLVLNIWLYSTAGLFLIPLGMFIANFATRYNPYISTRELLSKEIILSKLDKSNIFYFLLIILFLLSISVFFLYLSKIGKLPIFEVFNGLSSLDLAYLRSESGNDFSGKMYRYNMFMRILPLFILLILFFLKNTGLKWKIFFYIVLLYNMFVSIMDIQKAPIIKLFLILMFAYFFSKNKISRKVFIITGLISTSLIILMYMFFMGMSDRSFFEIAGAPLHRIFIGQIHPFYWWQMFQEQNGYIYGTSFPNPAHIFPFEWRRITVEIMNFAHPELAKHGIVGSMPTVFFADWFINFGPLMALFSMVLFGFIIQIFDIYFITNLAKNKSLLFSVLFIFMINYFGQFASTGFQGMIIDTKLYLPIVILIILKVMRLEIYKNLRRMSAKNSNLNSIK